MPYFITQYTAVFALFRVWHIATQSSVFSALLYNTVHCCVCTIQHNTCIKKYSLDFYCAYLDRVYKARELASWAHGPFLDSSEHFDLNLLYLGNFSSWSQKSHFVEYLRHNFLLYYSILCLVQHVYIWIKL